MATDALAVFVAARLDEEVRAATVSADRGYLAALQYPDGHTEILGTPGRLLREVEIKRARLRRYIDSARGAAERRAEGHPSVTVENIRDAQYVEILADAAVWSDHPDCPLDESP